MKDVEIEIKVRVSDATKLEAFLGDKARFLGEEYQKDEYFTPAHRNFIAPRPTAEWLRLRTSETNSIAYKHWHFDQSGHGTYCDEYETSISSVGQLHKIFQALDIEPVMTVEKKRRSWRYHAYEVALDHVTGLGDFVEIEFRGSTESVKPKQITDAMITLLKDIGCGRIERNHQGYPFMLLYPDEVAFETV
jgi:adenylate cyclase, class 2